MHRKRRASRRRTLSTPFLRGFEPQPDELGPRTCRRSQSKRQSSAKSWLTSIPPKFQGNHLTVFVWFNADMYCADFKLNANRNLNNNSGPATADCSTQGNISAGGRWHQ